MTLTPPPAAKIPSERTFHGDTFLDHYEWLREKESPQVVAHIEAENTYAEAVTEHLAGLREELFQDIKKRTQETDLSVPMRTRDWWHFVRTKEGSQYPIVCRLRAVDAAGEAEILAGWTPPIIEADSALPGEEVVIDLNEEARGHSFISLGPHAYSECDRYFAYGLDVTGDERFTIRIKDLATGKLLDDVIDNAFYALCFSPDGKDIYYQGVDDSWRPHQVLRHRIGTDCALDEVIYQEDDPGLWVSFAVSNSLKYLQIDSSCSEFNESHFFDFNEGPVTAARVAAKGQFSPVISRDERVLYNAEDAIIDGRERIILVHNHEALNSMISVADAAELAKPFAQQRWDTVMAHDNAVRVEGAGVLTDYLLVSVRANTTERVQFVPLSGLGTAQQAAGVEPKFAEEIYTSSANSGDMNAPIVRLTFQSYVTPPQVYDYVLATGELLLRKEVEILGGYDPSDYAVERHWAPARDGKTLIPVSVVRKKGVGVADAPGQSGGVSAPAPVYMYGYGSYEHSLSPGVSIARLSLLERGVIMVFAHVRGGGEMGRLWYEDGKKLQKKNTFTDFVDVRNYLASQPWVDAARIAAAGGSAGGLLMGAVVNLAPEAFCGILAEVPFVDALTTILDPNLPLTATEWEEWGNPIEDPEVYAAMKAYTPYENIAAVPYPPIAAMTSFHDTRVLYVEPAKWVARLREITTGEAPIIMRTEMSGGHGGASGRYEAWKESAWGAAFVLDCLGVADTSA